MIVVFDKKWKYLVSIFASIHSTIHLSELELDLLFGLDDVTSHCTSSFHSKNK